jgi:hypothetical protein
LGWAKSDKSVSKSDTMSLLIKSFTRKGSQLGFFDFAQTYANLLPMVGVLKNRKKFFLPTLLWGDRAQNVVFGVKIRVQSNGHNCLWLKAFQ